MRILVINDDGIHSEGIKILAEFAKTLGEVTVVAPFNEQSGKSQSIDYHNTHKAEKFDFLDGVDAYYVDSTPADCARFAFLALDKVYDLVLTGINRGYNLGNDILYSGTAGAAFESYERGVKAIAFSTNFSTFESAKQSLPMIFDFIFKNKLLDKNGIYNVNIPLEPIGIKVTRKGGFYYTETYKKVENGEWFQSTDFVPTYTDDLQVDVNAVMNSYISITPMTTDRTEQNVFKELVNLTK